MATQVAYPTWLLVNLLAALCIAILLGLGVYVCKVPLLVGGFSTSGFNVIQANQSSWNVACTVLGTAVGLLLTWGFASHDDFITRKEILSKTGVLAMYLRPLSARRGLEQLQRGRFPAIRSFLILATIVSTLTSTATVAIFGIHTESIEVFNPLASYPLAAFGDEYAILDPEQTTFFKMFFSEVPLLSSFLYRDAYIRSLQTLGTYRPFDTATGAIESGPIGDTIYPGLNTSGIGLNATSYTQHSGLSYGYNLPASYTFERLDAAVFATNVSVSCSNDTGSYSIVTADDDDGVRRYYVWKDNFPNTTLIQDISYDSSLVISSVVTEQNDEPLHTFIFPGGYYESPFILECTYGGNEFLASISLLDRVSPIQVNGVIEQGSSLNTTIKWQLSNITHNYIYYYGHGAPGGSIADAWISSKYYFGYTNNTFTAELMGTIVSELGQAFYSLMRQGIEIADQFRSQDQVYDNGSFVKMVVAVLRVGGASYAWLSIYALMFVAAMLGVVIASIKKQVVQWKSQDPVSLLKKCLPESNIDEVTLLRYGDQFEVIGVHDTEQPTKLDEPRTYTSSAVEEVTEQEV
ncbi:hypothetical protein OIDMADRAFT_31179 [Oidiodendron maius Zn]|uniref:Uncharacterized protein n=1 Tax=Oidiodendron maius (strain Zn) TaxID=913774 RepID=A0A0C3H7H0_OIDMZ|nr:hypothetical protein OIDMADRAFT_31179 [Oidiodendron maius Zn]